jgi:hypothetical protein
VSPAIRIGNIRCVQTVIRFVQNQHVSAEIAIESTISVVTTHKCHISHWRCSGWTALLAYSMWLATTIEYRLSVTSISYSPNVSQSPHGPGMTQGSVR